MAKRSMDPRASEIADMTQGTERLLMRSTSANAADRTGAIFTAQVIDLPSNPVFTSLMYNRKSVLVKRK